MSFSGNFTTTSSKLRRPISIPPPWLTIIRFHHGEPVTSEDVKLTYENDHGMNAKFIQDKTERVEIVDPRTVQFHFKEPFMDFLLYYATPASGIGIRVPRRRWP